MALTVDQLSLGPIGTNCYVVRADPTGREAVVVDPSGSEDELRSVLAEREARCVAILLTHGHWDHLVGVADLADATAAPVYMAEGERSLLDDPNRFTPPGLTVRPYSPDVLLSGGDTIEIAGLSFDVLSVPGHSPAHVAVLRERDPLLGRRALRRLGRTYRLSRKRLGRAGRLDSLAHGHAAHGHNRVPGSRSGDDAR